jgi:hypothetical protein
VPLLRRLAIYGVNRSTLGPDEKLGWLLDNELLTALGLRHEVFILIRDSYPGGQTATRQRLLETAKTTYITPKKARATARETRQAHEFFTLLDWIRRFVPGCTFVLGELQQLQRAFPEFKPMEHREFEEVVSSCYTGHQSPWPVEYLLSKLPDEVIDTLLSFSGVRFDGPDREGLLETVSEAVMRSFEWSWKLARVLRAKGKLEGDLWEAIVRGWREASLTPGEWSQVLLLLGQESTLVESTKDLCMSLLSKGLSKSESPLPQELWPQAQDLADAIWQACRTPATAKKGVDWASEAVRNIGGSLVDFWLRMLEKLRKEAGNEWHGLPSRCRKSLDEVVAGGTLEAQMGRVLLSARIHYLFYLDSAWARHSLLPLFKWTKDRAQAYQAWSGYLTWGECTGLLLPNILPFLKQTFRKLREFTKDHRKRLCHLLAVIALRSETNPLTDWLGKFLADAEEQDIVAWEKAIARNLPEMPKEAVIQAWKSWLGPFWGKRIEGMPTRLGQREISQLQVWPLGLEPVFAEAVQLACQMPPADSEDGFVYRNILQDGLCAQHPTDTAKWVLRLLRGTRQPFYECDGARKVVNELISTGGAPEISKELLAQLARLGCP